MILVTTNFGEMGLNDILGELVRVSPFVALLGVACWMLWRKINEKDELLNEQRKEVLKAYIENIKTSEAVTALLDTMKSEISRDFRDIHARLDRLENAKRND